MKCQHRRQPMRRKRRLQPPAPVAAAAAPTDDSGFQPVPFSFDDFGGDEPQKPLSKRRSCRFATLRSSRARSFIPRATKQRLLLRDLSSIGEMSINCDMDALAAARPDGSGRRLFLLEDLDQDRKGEEGVRSVFEFAEWDCDLEIKVHEPQADDDATEELPMQPVPFDLSILDGESDDGRSRDRSRRTKRPKLPPRSSAWQQRLSAKPAAAAPAKAAAAESKPLLLHANADSQACRRLRRQTIRVDLDRVDRLINLVGELVINQAMLSQSVIENETSGTSTINIGLEELQQLTREIQDCVMAIRAQPVKPVFQRMSRIVREVADMTGKSVRLITEGENTEVDKTVIDKLAEPLTHMIRNAVDHGLESPEKRIAAGKNPEGTVKLTAKHRSGRIVIELSDDGAGINRETVRQKAIDNDLITSDANLSDEEIDNLIFSPGFSTADKISDISGRGVGMDVVKRSIQALGGRINISSRPGQGSTFTMSLPLTLAVLDGMVVTVAGQTLVVPLTAIVETLQPEAAADSFVRCQPAPDFDPRKLLPAGRCRPDPELPRHPGQSDRRRGASGGIGKRRTARTDGRCHPGSAPGRHQEPGGQLHPCSGHRGRDHSGRRPRGAHSGCGCCCCGIARSVTAKRRRFGGRWLMD